MTGLRTIIAAALVGMAACAPAQSAITANAELQRQGYTVNPF